MPVSGGRGRAVGRQLRVREGKTKVSQVQSTRHVAGTLHTLPHSIVSKTTIWSHPPSWAAGMWAGVAQTQGTESNSTDSARGNSTAFLTEI